MPPNSQGLTVLLTLGILEHFDLSQYPVDSAHSIHLQIEAMKLAFADASRYIADPQSMTININDLLNKDYLKSKAKLINLEKARAPEDKFPIEKGTVYLTTADQNGMMVSFIQSNFIGFGSGIVIPDSGISLQNRGFGFTLEKNHPNQVAGNKLPFHTIIPGFIFKKGKPLMSFGVMGGYMQAQGHVQMITRVCDYNQNPQAAIDAPRWYIAPDHCVSLEEETNSTVVNTLKNYSHRLMPNSSMVFGGAQAIYCLPTTGY